MAATPETAQAFLELLKKSSLVEEKELAHYLKQHTNLPGEVKALSQVLIKDGLITNFHAKQLLAGRHKGFVVGNYKILEQIGVGGMGAVYLGEHKAMKRFVALKFLPADKAKDPDSVARFYREARAVAALDHPNIVRAHDVLNEAGMHFLVMEYVDGTSLYDIVKRHGALDPIRAAHYIAQAAVGLQHAFERGMIHRDIKPANLLLDRSGTIKVLDLGLARLFEEKEGLTENLSGSVVLGTADYVSPEQAINSHNVDIRTDIYSLGATFYYLLAAQPPFKEGTVAQKLLAHQLKVPPPIRTLRPQMPEQMALVVNKMMKKEPAKRYQTPADVVAALEPWTQQPIAPPSDAEMPHRGPKVARVISTGPASQVTQRSMSGIRTIKVRKERPVHKQNLGAAGMIAAGIAGLCVIMGMVAMWWAWSLAAEQPPPPPKPNPQANANRAFTTPPPEASKVQKTNLQPTPYQVRQFDGHGAGVESVALIPNSPLIATGSQDRTVRFWNMVTGQPMNQIQYPDRVHAVVAASDGQSVFIAGWAPDIQRCDVKSGRVRAVYPGNDGGVMSLGLSSDGRRLASGGFDGVVKVWDVESRRELQRMTGHTDSVWSLSFSDDGTQIFTGSYDGTVRLWDARSGRQLQNFQEHVGKVSAVAVAWRSRVGISGGDDGVLRVWNLRLGKLEKEISAPDAIYGLAITEDGRRAITGGKDKKVIYWDLQTGQEIRQFKGHTNSVWTICITPSGKQFLSAGADRSVRLWENP
jgi:serine/threonine protein kinase